MKQCICSLWLYWLPQNYGNCNRICVSLSKIQPFIHIFRSLNKFVEGTWQRLHLQTEDRWLTTLSSLLHFGLAQRRQTLLSLSPPPRPSLLCFKGTIHHASTINHGIETTKQGKSPSCHECGSIIPPEMQWCNVQGTCMAVILLMSGHPFLSCVT